MFLHKWTITLEEDKETGDLYLPLPDDLLLQMNWSEGTELQWIDNKDGTFTLINKEENVISS